MFVFLVYTYFEGPMRNIWFQIVTRFIVFALGAGIVTAFVVHNPGFFDNFARRDIPSFVKTVEKKLGSIHTPTSHLTGSLSAARDLRGTWHSSISGKGFQLYGRFNTGPGITTVYEDGDITLIITAMGNGFASGTIQYTNICAQASTWVPTYGNVTGPAQCGNYGAQPITIGVSGSRLNFGTINTNGASFTMGGSYTTNIMSGTMTMTTGYGVVKGEFHLIRRL